MENSSIAMNSSKITRNQTSEHTIKQFSSLSSCFLTPDSVQKRSNFGRVTPTLDQSSSVFLSPPSSLERGIVPHFAIPTKDGPLKVELDFHDDGSEPRCVDRSPKRPSLLPANKIIGLMIGRTKVDFIAELLNLNCEQIVKTICSYLDDSDLCRFASISKKWRTFVKYTSSPLYDRWKTFIKQRKQHCIQKGKENKGSPSSGLKDPKDFPRTPLLDIEVNRESSRKVSQVTSKTHMLSKTLQRPESSQRTPLSETYRPCPNCSSPSKVIVHEGFCQCQRCELKYCVKCLRDIKFHKENKCKGLDEPQDRREKRTRQRRKGMEQVVGSKQNKDRVKRL